MQVDIYKTLEERIFQWGKRVEEVSAIYILGSRAREDKPFDEFSDLDVVVYLSNPDYYFQNDDWLMNIGEVWTSFLFRTAGGDPEKLVLLDKGAQVDFLFQPTSDFRQLIKDGRIPLGFQRGAKILLDKTGDGQKLLPKALAAPEGVPVSYDAFNHAVSMFCFATLYVAKQILRNEIWVVKERDRDCKGLLLQMMEWHAKALNGNTYDTWHAGKFIHDWAEKEVVEDLKQAFGGYDQLSNWHALIASFNLFRRLSGEVASKYNYSYPDRLFLNVEGWITEHRESLLLSQ